MKYKLINNQTKEEHLCDKVTIDGFDYYVNNYISDEVNGNLEKIPFEKLILIAVATNNPNIDIPKVVDAKLLKYKIAEHEYPAGKRERKHTEQEAFINGWNKCLQSQESYSFSEKDMIEFLDWKEQQGYVFTSDGFAKIGDFKFYTSKELLQLWKEQRPKIIYYNE